MSPVYSINDLINIAISIETRGISFYDVMAKSTDNDEARDVFEELVEMEREHIDTFQDMFRVDVTSTLENTSYIKSLIDSAVFTDDLITSELATQADSDIKALELAISAEKDSILFYYEIRDHVPVELLPAINKVIAEEKSHLQKLSEIKNKLATR